MIDEKMLIKELSKNSIFEKVTVGEETVYDVINRLPKVGEWIPCDKELPPTDKNKNYLVCGNRGGIYIAEFVCKTVNGSQIGPWWSASGRYCPEPIAWMPLPEPYKKNI